MIEVTSLQDRLEAFMEREIYPSEAVYEQQLRTAADRFAQPPVMDELQAKARAEGLWNLFLPEREFGAGLTNREYAPLCETMGRSAIAPEAFNCSAPDTGNMEVFARYGSPAHQQQWLPKLLGAEIRSGFAMTEPDVASSDATNISAEIRRDGDHYVVNGRKWWTTGAAHPRCKVLIFLGRSDPGAARHQQHSMLVIPMDAPGVRVVRNLSVFGYDEAPHGHCEIDFENVRVPLDALLLGEGRGFEIGQGRLGPGPAAPLPALDRGRRARARDHVQAREKRVAFGKPIAAQGVVMEWIADSRIEIDQARLLVYEAADRLDKEGNKVAKDDLAMAKVVAPSMALRVVDRAIQAFGAKGVSDDTFLAGAWAGLRTLRLADGPDEVHRASIAKSELKKGER